MLSQTLSGLPLATLDPTAPSSQTKTAAPPPIRPPGTIERALEVVLERTRRGGEELNQNRFGLGAARRQLLGAIDGVRALGQLTQPDATPNAQRLVSDAARLVAFGLCRAVRGELPQRFMVAAMNLTLRMPRALVATADAPMGHAATRPAPAVVRHAAHDELQRENNVLPLRLAAAIVLILLFAWFVFEIARA